jgi:hypothetical protein
MKPKIQILIGILILAAMVLACGISIPNPQSPASVATMIEGTVNPDAIATMAASTLNPDTLGTMVAATLQALSTSVSGGVSTPVALPTLPSLQMALPRSLYFVNKDAGGILQLFRIERDGVTTSQITHEVTNVGDYSIALDGRIAYTIENQLLIENADGSGRRVLVDGGAVDPNNPYLTRVSAPAWSPDGLTIAFGYKGLNFYNMVTGTYSLALANTFDTSSGLTIPRELYFPREYSPDGSSLLISIGYYEGGTYAIYRILTATLVRPSPSGMLCCSTIWTWDSSSFYFASSSMGMIDSGLWRFGLDGTVTTLLPGSAADGTYNFADFPYLALDGQLYYFFANLKDIPSGHTPLTLVRSAADGVTGRTSILPGSFPALNEALWAPDASLVVIADASSMPDEWSAGRLIAIYIDGRPAQVLAPFGSNMKWGP